MATSSDADAATEALIAQMMAEDLAESYDVHSRSIGYSIEDYEQPLSSYELEWLEGSFAENEETRAFFASSSPEMDSWPNTPPPQSPIQVTEGQAWDSHTADIDDLGATAQEPLEQETDISDNGTPTTDYDLADSERRVFSLPPYMLPHIDDPRRTVSADSLPDSYNRSTETLPAAQSLQVPCERPDFNLPSPVLTNPTFPELPPQHTTSVPNRVSPDFAPLPTSAQPDKSAPHLPSTALDQASEDLLSILHRESHYEADLIPTRSDVLNRYASGRLWPRPTRQAPYSADPRLPYLEPFLPLNSWRDDPVDHSLSKGKGKAREPREGARWAKRKGLRFESRTEEKREEGVEIDDKDDYEEYDDGRILKLKVPWPYTKRDAEREALEDTEVVEIHVGEDETLESILSDISLREQHRAKGKMVAV
ncbi:hypothetical protein MMC28_003303 [Mycoblastus sanguinarius]|nr:hypothetical protein [Mycoblastus sanguinarius]